MQKLIGLSLLLCFAALGLVACGDDDDASESRDVVRSVLASTQPGEAPGHELLLQRVTIPEGGSIAAHTHPGPQMAWVLQGELTYTVETGEMIVLRDAATDDEKRETVPAGQTILLEEGDSIIEAPGAVHRAENQGDEDVILLLSALFEEGAPLSSPADSAAGDGDDGEED